MASPDNLHSAPAIDAGALARVAGLELRARLIVEGYLTGLHRSPYHGFSVEFAEHRAYQPGENPRAIDWRVFGRTERLFIKRFEEETNLRAHFMLDVSDSMRYPVADVRWPSKLNYGVHLVAALAMLLLRQRDAVGLTVFDSVVRQFMPTRAQSSWLRPMLATLEGHLAAEATFSRTTAAPEVLHSLIPKLGRRGLIVLVSDFLPNGSDLDFGLARLKRALQHLRHARHEVLLVQLLDHRTEVAFDVPNQPLRLRDLESGDELRVHPTEVRAAYVQGMARYLAQLNTLCREMQIDRLELDIRTPFDRAVAAYLRRRSR